MNDFWHSKRVVVTGAAGFIGAHLTKALLNAGASVFAIDPAITPTWKILVGDLATPINPTGGLWLTIRQPNPDVVFHVAGMSHIGACQARPNEAYHLNVSLTQEVLWACRNGRIPAVFASSNHVYGSAVQQSQVFHEDDALHPADVYGATKAAADVLVTAAAREGLPVVALRHVNAYGPADPHLDHLIPYVIRATMAGQTVRLRSRGGPRKGYLYITDVVAAYMLLGELAATGTAKGAYNCATTAWATRPVHSVLEVLDIIQRELGVTVRYEFAETDEQAGYTEILSSVELYQAGWSPKVSFREGVRLTADWFEDHPEWPHA